jgi:hypothetical protein
MRRLVMFGALVLLPGISVAGDAFDGNWSTKLTCPAKGKTEGYTWQFASVIQNSNFHGERGTAGEPGYLLIEGKIAADGSAKLSANGIVASRKYARGVCTSQMPMLQPPPAQSCACRPSAAATGAPTPPRRPSAEPRPDGSENRAV